MTATRIDDTMNTTAPTLRVLRIGVAAALLGMVLLWAVTAFASTVDEGDFKYAGDYWLTASALPMGVGLLLHALALHRLHGGRDGRLGTVGTWLYVLCNIELVIQCMASIAVGAELRWGPTYVLSSFLTFVGLALVAAGAWRAGVLPRWMLGVWPPLALLGSWLGTGPIPLVFALFLVGTAVVAHRRGEAAVGRQGSQREDGALTG